LCFGLLAIGSIVCCAVFTRAAVVSHCPITLVPNGSPSLDSAPARGEQAPNCRAAALRLPSQQSQWTQTPLPDGQHSLTHTHSSSLAHAVACGLLTSRAVVC
jgi:hypothetical protein